jgi:hypothetical protein
MYPTPAHEIAQRRTRSVYGWASSKNPEAGEKFDSTVGPTVDQIDIG